jgi:hypothetical protein
LPKLRSTLENKFRAEVSVIPVDDTNRYRDSPCGVYDVFPLFLCLCFATAKKGMISTQSPDWMPNILLRCLQRIIHDLKSQIESNEEPSANQENDSKDDHSDSVNDMGGISENEPNAMKDHMKASNTSRSLNFNVNKLNEGLSILCEYSNTPHHEIQINIIQYFASDEMISSSYQQLLSFVKQYISFCQNRNKFDKNLQNLRKNMKEMMSLRDGNALKKLVE